jgi:exopolysaccharide biosynthesis WecB/TagA/CpsF family protein
MAGDDTFLVVNPLEILHVPLSRLTAEQALKQIEILYEHHEPAFVVHANAHTLNLAYDDPEYAEVLRRADLVLNDGKGVMLAARIKGERLPADLNGNMFTPLMLQKAAAEGWRVFFLGAGPGVADRAAEVLLRRFPGLEICGTRDGYFSSDEEAISAVKQAETDVLIVGMGNPLQERWLDRCLASTGARLGIGVGAFLDFITGTVPRAPRWMNRMGIEWLHRLAKEPRRMWRRYIIGNPRFISRVVRERVRGRAASVE